MTTPIIKPGDVAFTLRPAKDVSRLLKVQMQRGTVDQKKECGICLAITPRVIAFKKDGDPSYRVLWICDFCLRDIRQMEAPFIGL